MKQPATITMDARQWAGLIVATIVYVWLAFHGYLSAVGIWAAQDPSSWLRAQVGVMGEMMVIIWVPALVVLAGYAVLLTLFRLPWQVRLGCFTLLTLAVLLLLL